MPKELEKRLDRVSYFYFPQYFFKKIKALLNQIPLGRLGKPSDIAHAVAYLASPRAAYVTGQELHVNGGMYM